MPRLGGHSADIPPKRCAVCRMPIPSQFTMGQFGYCACRRCLHNVQAQIRQPGVCQACQLEELEDAFSKSFSGEGEL